MRELIRKILRERMEDKTEKFIKCRECNKKFTQTIHKGKKSLPICPYCGAHNTDKKEIDEDFRDILFDKFGFKTKPFQEFQRALDVILNNQKFIITKDKDSFGHDKVMFTRPGDKRPIIQVMERDNEEKGIFKKDKIKTAWIDQKFMNRLQGYIPSQGAINLLLNWLQKTLDDKTIVDYDWVI